MFQNTLLHDSVSNSISSPLVSFRDAMKHEQPAGPLIPFRLSTTCCPAAQAKTTSAAACAKTRLYHLQHHHDHHHPLLCAPRRQHHQHGQSTTTTRRQRHPPVIHHILETIQGSPVAVVVVAAEDYVCPARGWIRVRERTGSSTGESVAVVDGGRSGRERGLWWVILFCFFFLFFSVLLFRSLTWGGERGGGGWGGRCRLTGPHCFSISYPDGELTRPDRGLGSVCPGLGPGGLCPVQQTYDVEFLFLGCVGHPQARMGVREACHAAHIG